jgi:hypothetical protein
MTFFQTNKGNTVCGCAEARNRCVFLCLIERGGVDFPERLEENGGNSSVSLLGCWLREGMMVMEEGGG